MTENNAPPQSLVILQPPAKRRWHARRGRGQGRRLPPLHHKEADSATNEETTPPVQAQLPSSLMKAEALYGGRSLSPPPRVPKAPVALVVPERERKVRVVDQLVQESPAPSPLSPIQESIAERSRSVSKEDVVQEVCIEEDSGDSDEEMSDADHAAYMVESLVGYATDAFSDGSSGDAFARTCEAWSFYSADCEDNVEETRAEEVKPSPPLGIVSPVDPGGSPVRPPPPPGTVSPVVPGAALARQRGPVAARSVVVGRDRHSPSGMPTLDDLLAKPKGPLGKGTARSLKSSPRTRLAPVDAPHDRRVPLTAR